MAQSFPLPLATFAGKYRIDSMTFDLSESRSISQTGAGEILTADNGARLWTGSVQMTARSHDDSADAEAMLSILRETGASFMMADLRRPGPRADADGVWLGTATPVLAAIATNNRDISISGLPAAYVLSRGDMIAWTYLTSPVRYALHRIVTGGAANGTGLCTGIEVTPRVRSGVTIGSAVTLIRPTCKAIIVPGTVAPGNRNLTATSSIAFRFTQTLR
jgi:hypothetical protein